jgi:hypothetical protein
MTYYCPGPWKDVQLMVQITALEASQFLATVRFSSGVLSLKALLTSKRYHIIITTNIPVNRLARQLEGNIRKHAGRGNVTPGGRYERLIHETSFWGLSGVAGFMTSHKHSSVANITPYSALLLCCELCHRD